MFFVQIFNRLRRRSARRPPQGHTSSNNGAQDNSASSSMELSTFSYTSTRIETSQESDTSDVYLAYKNTDGTYIYCQAIQQGGEVSLLMNLEKPWAINKAAKFKHTKTIVDGHECFTLQNESITGYLTAQKLPNSTYLFTIPEVMQEHSMCNFVTVDKEKPCNADKDSTKDKCVIEDIDNGKNSDNYSFKLQNYTSGWYLKVENNKIVGTDCCSEATVFYMKTNT